MDERPDAEAAQFRLSDLRLTIELLVEAVANERGARDRIATRHGIAKSVITDRVKRIERFFGVQLMAGAQRKTPTGSGRLLARRGPQFIGDLEAFGEMLREADDDVRQNDGSND